MLAELALDAEKNINKGGVNVRQGQGKSKDKKKKKDPRKAKDSKVLITSFLLLQQPAVVVLSMEAVM